MSDAAQKKKISHLIESFYDAAVDERSWYALAPQIANAFGSTSTTLLVLLGKGRALRMKSGRLTAANPSDTARLLALI